MDLSALTLDNELNCRRSAILQKKQSITPSKDGIHWTQINEFYFQFPVELYSRHKDIKGSLVCHFGTRDAKLVICKCCRHLLSNNAGRLSGYWMCIGAVLHPV